MGGASHLCFKKWKIIDAVSSHVKGSSFEKPKLFPQKENIFLLLLNIAYIATLELFFSSGPIYLNS